MKKKFIFILLLKYLFFHIIIISLSLNGFSGNILESLPLDSAEKTTIKPIFQLDAHRSLFLNQWVKVNGIRIGMNLDDYYRLGLAFYTSDFVRLEDQVINSDSFFVKIQYVSRSAFIEYDIIDNYKWNWSAFSSLGSGRGAIELKRKDNLLDSSATINRIPQFNVGTALEYKVWPFLGAGIGCGYRILKPNKAFLSEVKTSRAFSSPYYSVKIKVHLSELYKFIFNKDLYNAEKEEYLESKSND